MTDPFEISKRLEFLRVYKHTGDQCWVPYLTHTNDLDYEALPLVYENATGHRSTRPRDPNKAKEQQLHVEFCKTYKPVSRLLRVWNQ